jgi:hypothetical protein
MSLNLPQTRGRSFLLLDCFFTKMQLLKHD